MIWRVVGGVAVAAVVPLSLSAPSCSVMTGKMAVAATAAMLTTPNGPADGNMAW